MSNERYEVLGTIGRGLQSTIPKDLAADLNSAGLALIAEHDDNHDEPVFMVAEYEEESEGLPGGISGDRGGGKDVI